MLERDIIKVNLPDSYRVICIADIHGNFTAFKRLLSKVNLFYQGTKKIKKVKKSKYFTECEVVSEWANGLKGLIKNEYIEEKGKTLEYWDSMANFVSVNKNEIVSVIDNSCKGYTYIRNSKGELGWIPKKSVNLKI